MMEEIKKIFKKRDSAFEKQTLEIFKQINTALVSVTRFLNDIDPTCEAGNLSWEDTNLVDDLIVIIGTVQFTPNTTVEIDGELVSITEDNMDYFNRVIHMSLPYDLVVEGDEDIITEFLYDIHNEEIAKEALAAHEESQGTDLDFDLSKLSDDQMHALELFHAREKK